jgi:purine-binding chemotaxis protein CheW
MDTYLTFKLGNELFAVPVTHVLEVLQKPQITQVPKTPNHILGIINFRGDILTVIDTRRKFGMEGSGIENQKIVIVFELNNEIEKHVIAATADKVNDVIDIHEHEIKSVPELGLSYDVRFVKGAIRRNEEFILLLNIDIVFSSGDLAVTNVLNNLEEDVRS